MSSGNKRRFFNRDAAPVVASDDDFDAVFGPMTELQASAPQDIPIERIRPNPYQARVKFKDIDDLAESMRTHGFTSRLRVRRAPDQPQSFQLVYGERRLRAAQVVGITMIPCDVAEYSDQQMREIGLTENLQRSDLEPLEEARALRAAIDEGGYSIRTLAAQIGKSKGYVQGRLDLLRAPEDVQALVDQHPDTFTAGLLIAQLPTPELRQPLIASVINGDLDKEALRGIVRSLAATMVVSTERSVEDAVNDRIADSDTAEAGRRAERTVLGTTDLAPQVDRSSTAKEQRRATRHSQQALQRATQTLQAMTEQLQQTLPEIQAAERSALLDFIVKQHFPKLEVIIGELRDTQEL